MRLRQQEQALLASGAPIFSRAGMLVEPVTEDINDMIAADGRKTRSRGCARSVRIRL
jgi:hypothetical protein